MLGALRLGRRAPSPDPRRGARRSLAGTGGTKRRGLPRAVRAEDVSTAAAAKDLDEAVALMREVGWWLALGLANLAAILDCGHFVIGGGLIEAHRTRAARRARVPGRPGRGVRDASDDHRDAVAVRAALGRDGCRTRGLRGRRETRRPAADVSGQRATKRSGLRRRRRTRPGSTASSPTTISVLSVRPTRPTLAPLPVLAAVARARDASDRWHTRRPRGPRGYPHNSSSSSRRSSRSRPDA